MRDLSVRKAWRHQGPPTEDRLFYPEGWKVPVLTFTSFFHNDQFRGHRTLGGRFEKKFAKPQTIHGHPLQL